MCTQVQAQVLSPFDTFICFLLVLKAMYNISYLELAKKKTAKKFTEI